MTMTVGKRFLILLLVQFVCAPHIAALGVLAHQTVAHHHHHQDHHGDDGGFHAHVEDHHHDHDHMLPDQQGDMVPPVRSREHHGQLTAMILISEFGTVLPVTPIQTPASISTTRDGPALPVVHCALLI